MFKKAKTIVPMLVMAVILSIPLYLIMGQISQAIGLRRYDLSMREAYQLALKEAGKHIDNPRLYAMTSVDIDRDEKYDGTSGKLPHWNLDFVASDNTLYHIAVRDGQIAQSAEQGTGAYADTLVQEFVFVDSTEIASLAADHGLVPYQGKWGRGFNFALSVENEQPQINVRGATQEGIAAFLTFDANDGTLLFGAERIVQGGGLHLLTNKTVSHVFPTAGQLSDNISVLTAVSDDSGISIIYAGTDTRRDFLFTEHAQVLASYNDGKTWSSLDFPMENSDAVLCIQSTTNGNVLFVGTTDGLAIGKVENIEDDGFVWQFPKSGLPTGHITALALSPSFSTDQTIWAAVGRPTNESSLWAESGSEGLFYSTNGGDTWARVNSAPESVADIIFSPDYSVDGTTFLLSEMALYKSENKGETWHQLPLKTSGLLQLAISPDFAIDQTLYVASIDALWHSVDSGETWLRLTEAKTYPVSVALSPVFGKDQAVAYSAFRSGLFISYDGGKTWDHPEILTLGDLTPRAITFLKDSSLVFSIYPILGWHPLYEWLDETGQPISYPTSNSNP